MSYVSDEGAVEGAPGTHWRLFAKGNKVLHPGSAPQPRYGRPYMTPDPEGTV
jgi:hypothetical protein